MPIDCGLRGSERFLAFFNNEHLVDCIGIHSIGVSRLPTLETYDSASEAQG